jgi:hypothetical protein
MPDFLRGLSGRFTVVAFALARRVGRLLLAFPPTGGVG